MIVIYGSYRSRATRNIWLLEEIGRLWKLAPVFQHYRPAAQAGDHGVIHTRMQAFLDRFPAGTIPVMEDGDICLSESLAINLYLAKRYGGDIAGRSREEEALCTQWSFFAATSLEPGALKLAILSQSGHADPAEIEACVSELQRPLTVFERGLQDRDWTVGGAFTVADINLAEILRYATACDGLLDRFPATAAWLDRCHARPAFQRMWALREAEPA